MKQALFLLVVTAVFISCNDTTKVAASTDDKTADKKAHENMLEVYKAIQTGDVSKLDSSMIAQDFVDHNANMDGSDIKGIDSAKKMLSQVHTFFEDGFKVDLLSDALSSDGNYEYATVRMTGKAKPNPWGMKVGETFDQTSVDVVKMKDGKATDHWGYMSMADFNTAMKNMQGAMQPMKDSKK